MSDFVNHSYDYRPNWTPLSPITIIYLQVSCGIVRLLLEYGANPDLLCEGHSALSLAIYSGNDLVRDEHYACTMDIPPCVQ